MPLPGKLQSYNLTKEEWQAMRNLVEDWSIIIKPADEGLCVEGLCNLGPRCCLAESYRQLSDRTTYTDKYVAKT